MAPDHAPFLPVLAAGATMAKVRAGLAPADPVLALPPLASGETRSLLFAEDRFALDGSGSVVAGARPCAAGTFHCVVRQTRGGQAVDTAIVVSVAAPAPEARWQGVGQGMRLVEGYAGGAARAMLSRTGHHANRPIRRFRVVVPVFWITGRFLADSLFDAERADMRFQVGLEYPFAERFEAIAPRVPVTFGGQSFGRYGRAGWDEATGHLLSDPVDLPFEIPARTRFGLWTSVELPAGSYRNALPYSWSGSNHVERFGGVRLSDAALIEGVDAALSAPSIRPFGDRQSGAAAFFAPAMLLVETPDERDCFVIIGDSIAKGVGAGGPGSDGFGDAQGDREGNFGAFDRALFHDLAADFVNLGKGSDGNKFLHRPQAARYRMALRRLAAPTATINMNGHNDVTQTAVMPRWEPGADQMPGDAIVVPGAGLYASLTGGPAGEVPPTGRGTRAEADATSWVRLSEDTGGESQRVHLQLARLAAVNAALKRDLPDDPLVGFCITPDAENAGGSWRDEDQTPRDGWGSASSRRGRWNAAIRRLDPLLSLDAFVDVNRTLEDGYPGETSRWAFANGRVTTDGTHLNSRGEEEARAPVAAALAPLKRGPR